MASPLALGRALATRGGLRAEPSLWCSRVRASLRSGSRPRLRLARARRSLRSLRSRVRASLRSGSRPLSSSPSFVGSGLSVARGRPAAAIIPLVGLCGGWLRALLRRARPRSPCAGGCRPPAPPASSPAPSLPSAAYGRVGWVVALVGATHLQYRARRWRLKPPSFLSADASPASIPCAISPSETMEQPAVVVGWWCTATLPQGFCFAVASPSDHAGFDEPRDGALGTSIPWILPGLAQGWSAEAAPAQQNTGQGRTGGFRWLGLRPVLYPPAPFPFAPLPCPLLPKGRRGERSRCSLRLFCLLPP